MRLILPVICDLMIEFEFGGNMVASGVVQNFQQLISSNDVFDVPHFQRNYSWELKQVEELFSDIEKTARNQEDHFMGSLILLRDDSSPGVVQVVDGQQRLTTLFMLLAIIRDKATELPIDSLPGGGFGAPVIVSSLVQQLLTVPGPLERLRFQPHPLIREMAAKHVWTYPGLDREALPTRHFNYTLDFRKAYKKINTMLNSALESELSELQKLTYLNNLVQTIQYKLQLLNVTSTNRAESYEIFMTLNSRGLPLGPSDLVKSEIFKNLTKGLSNSENSIRSAALTSDWRELEENLEGGDIDQYLRHFLVSSYDGALTSKRIFERVERIISGTSDSPLDPRVESEVFLKELIRNSEIYSKLLSGTDAELAGADLRLRVLFSVTDSYRIFLLPVLDPRVSLTGSERSELIRLTEVLAIRWILIGGNAQKLEDIFQTLSLKLRGGTSFSDIRLELVERMPEDDRVAREFAYEIDSKNLVRAILYSINRAWDRDGVVPLDSSKIHIEHIAPDKPTDHWMGVLFPNDEGVDREAEYSAAVELWGNKTLLDAKINQSIKQDSFIDKARGLTDDGWAGYQHSTISMTKDLGDKLNSWDRNEITDRSSWIADSFLKIWTPEPDLGSVVRYSTFRKSQ